MRQLAALALLSLCLACCTTTFLFAQRNYGAISGTVTNSNGAAISHAKVTADYVCIVPCVKKMALNQTEADDQGRYQFIHLPNARYALSAEKAEDDYPPLYMRFYRGSSKLPEVVLSSRREVATVDLVLERKAGVLIGTVADADTGEPLNANVEFHCLDEPTRDLSRYANATFRILIPSDSAVSMRVYQAGYEDWQFTQSDKPSAIRLQPGEVVYLDVRLKRTGTPASVER